MTRMHIPIRGAAGASGAFDGYMVAHSPVAAAAWMAALDGAPLSIEELRRRTAAERAARQAEQAEVAAAISEADAWVTAVAQDLERRRRHGAAKPRAAHPRARAACVPATWLTTPLMGFAQSEAADDLALLLQAVAGRATDRAALERARALGAEAGIRCGGNPWVLAAAEGIAVSDGPSVTGAFAEPAARRMTIDLSAGRGVATVSAAHEVGHIALAHRPGGTPAARWQVEAEATAYAAALLGLNRVMALPRRGWADLE